MYKIITVRSYCVIDISRNCEFFILFYMKFRIRLIKSGMISRPVCLSRQRNASPRRLCTFMRDNNIFNPGKTSFYLPPKFHSEG